MRRKYENHLAIGRGFCYYEKAVLTDNREGGASTNGKMSVLRQGLELRHQSEPLSPPLEPHLETNVKRVKAIVDGKPQHVYACTRCLRSGKVTRAV